MKYVISWFERPQGSPMEYENAQKRSLEVFRQWKAPSNLKIDFVVIRVTPLVIFFSLLIHLAMELAAD